MVLEVAVSKWSDVRLVVFEMAVAEWSDVSDVRLVGLKRFKGTAMRFDYAHLC